MIAVVGMIASRTGTQSSSKLLKTEATGADYLDVSNGSTQWGPFFSAVQDWELQSMDFFLEGLYDAKVQ